MINGTKVRIQLWDQGNQTHPESTFQPLFTRHAAGCIVVAYTSNLETLRKAEYWKKYYDLKTKVVNDLSYPSVLFINHFDQVPWDDTERLNNLERLSGDEGTFNSIFHVS